MSATPSHVGTEWGGAQSTPPPGSSQNDERNALQTLLALACLHQRAAQRKSQLTPKSRRSGSAPESEFGLDEALSLVAHRALSVTGCDGVAIALAQDDAILCRASVGEIAPPAGLKLDPKSGFSGICLRSGQTVRCNDSETDTRVNAQACRTLGTRSMIAVPLSAKQRVIGLIEAFAREPYGFNDADVKSLNLLGELILAAIRPEEEDRLAEISREIVVPEPARFSEVPGATGPKSSRIIVDEKFAPVAAAPPSESVAPELVPEPVLNAAVPSPAEESASQHSVAEESATSRPPLASRALGAVLPAHDLEAPGERPGGNRPVTSIAIVAASVLVAVGLGWGVLQKIRHAEQAISANTQPPVEVKTSSTQTTEILPTAPVPAPKPGVTPEVTGVRHWVSGNSSIVVVDLEDQVLYEDHTLENPPRIYIDLHDTKIAPALADRATELDSDPYLKRIRIAQPVEGITRVVLETKGDTAYSLRLDSSPYRLTIDVHKIEAALNIKTNPLPKPSPQIAAKQGSSAAGHSLSELRIVLDAGHGGWDLGTVGKKGLLEKDLVLDVVQRLGKLVEDKLDAQVIYTRQEDTYLPLEKRAEVANLAKADLFLSIHANYSDLATARGVETYYTNTYSSEKARTDGDDPQLKQVDWTGVDIRAKVTDSRHFAADVQQALYDGLAARNPDIRNRGVKKAEYVVLTGTQMPAVLAEVSFVSSPADEDKLRNSEYRQLIAEALYRGIVKYRNETKRTRLASTKKVLN
jgi:N-acetylmuramoyl-L-alanine amidase/putative methionine-R-sulfoxide reductase with GAF domain